MSKTVKLKRYRHVLDWFEVDDVEIDLDKFNSFEMQYRSGSWYLLHRVYEYGKFRNAYEHDFCLANPKQALQIGGKLKKFSSLHIGGEQFRKVLAELINA